MLAILLVPEEAPWSGLDSVRATVEVDPHISWGSGQFAGTVVEVVADMVVVGIVEDIVAEDVVEDVVVDVVVEASHEPPC